jgi:hypothetical protein
MLTSRISMALGITQVIWAVRFILGRDKGSSRKGLVFITVII